MKMWQYQLMAADLGTKNLINEIFDHYLSHNELCVGNSIYAKDQK